MLYLIFLMFFLGSCAESEKKITSIKTKDDSLIFESDFSQPLDLDTWKIEMDSTPNSSVYTQNGKLVMDTEGGVTVWLDLELEGNYEISYSRKVVLDSGKNDRISDLNQFWAASDPTSKGMFTRSGQFESYDDMHLYYVGFGGNHNSTTRFRKYDQGEKPVLGEYLEGPYLLQANHDYQIKTICKDGKVSFLVDDVLFFEYKDPEPLTSGYFGFRSTWSRQEISDLTITRL
ncbi:rhamnogalacturonan endolyase [Rhodonellum ikkaensis]|uniref:Rhamnogalacturonan endolyase n=1 Tax=Rhodonellum ikkaensis TaxID=336829 RepID=A0A1H3QLB0_9BACT|nr:rhamnogalacturonan endolyase [Rhodonellum ikkaensis]